MTWPPPGEYEPFRSWTTRERRWGAGGRSRVWFGSSVIDGLASVIDEHLAARRPGRSSDTRPAAIGCVPWLTHPGIAERLGRLGSCCVVVDKGGSARVPRVLRDAENRFPNVLPGLRDRLPGGTRAILGPYSPEPVFMVGPVRVVGMSGGGGKPLLHAKLLVLGWEMYGESEFGEEHHWFNPSSVWWGSANWTRTAPTHLEMGAWSDDEALTGEATEFLDALIGFSEPLTSTSVGPEADLVSVDYDDQAMAAAAAEMDWDDPDAP